MTLWPLILLCPAVIVTLLRGRSAWLWLSTALALCGLGALLFIASAAWARGDDGGLAARLLGAKTADRAYHDTYYVVVHVKVLLHPLLPCLAVGLLLLLPGQPRLDLRDRALFWAAALLWSFVILAPGLFHLAGGMPRRYIDYPDQIATLIGWTSLAERAAACVTAYAALRPVWRSVRGRRAHG